MGYAWQTGAQSAPQVRCQQLMAYFNGYFKELKGSTRPGYVKIANWKITMLLMGKSTISMVIFNSYFDITRG